MSKSGPGGEKYDTDYTDFIKAREDWLRKFQNDTNRFVRIGQRDDTSSLSHELFKKMERGKYMTDWRGVPMSKDPLDNAIYESILWDVKPRTVIELGTLRGGSALWLADHIQIFGLACHVFSFDRDFSHLHNTARTREGITFLQGDCNQIEKTFTPDMLKKIPHPWLIIEDAHVNLTNVLQHFNTYMKTGDYFVMEDGHPDTCTDCTKVIQGVTADGWGTSKLSILRSFLQDHSTDLMVDTYYTDKSGYNATFNMNGFIRKM